MSDNTQKDNTIRLSSAWLERVEKGRKLIKEDEVRAKEDERQLAISKSEPTPLSALRFARDIGMFPFSSPKETKFLEYKSQNGEYHVKIETSKSFDSIPTIEDERVLNFIVSKGREVAPDTKSIPKIVYFRLSECLDHLEKGHGGSQYNFMTNALDRYAGANIITNRFNRRGKEEKEVFTLFTYKKEKINERDAYVAVNFHESFLQYLRAGQLNAFPKPIELELKKTNSSSYRKTIITKVNAYMAGKEKQELMQSTLMELCNWKDTSRKFRLRMEKWSLPWKYIVEKDKIKKDYKYTFFALLEASNQDQLEQATQ